MADISLLYPVYISAGAIEHTIYCMYFLQGHSPLLSHRLQQAKFLDVNKKNVDCSQRFLFTFYIKYYRC
jgi:hypothetical protein